MVKFFNSILLDDGQEKKRYEGEVVDLLYRYEISEQQAADNIPTVYYDIVLHGTNTHVGSIDLRLKMNKMMYYYGHIGYDIIPKYRGHNYSYFACLLVFKIAKEERGLKELIVTCNPDNVASYKTLIKLNGKLEEVVQVPYDHELYKLGDNMKCIFRYKMEL